MKIIEKVEFKTKTGYVSNEMTVTEVPFSINNIDLFNIQGDPFNIEGLGSELPYYDPKLNKALEYKMDEMADACDWVISGMGADFNKTKISIFHDTCNDNFSLYMRIAPPDFSDEEREKILSEANKTFLDDDDDQEDELRCSEYNWLLQYEKNVKVISPLSVRDHLIEKAAGILNLYKEKSRDECDT